MIMTVTPENQEDNENIMRLNRITIFGEMSVEGRRTGFEKEKSEFLTLPVR